MAPGATREQITPSVQPLPHSQTSLLRILTMPNRRCKFATIYWRQIPRIPFFAAGASSRPRSRLPYYCGQKVSRAAGSTPARAAQGMATTSCCGNETAVRDWGVITSPCDASAVRRRRRLWRLYPASNQGCLSYLDQDFAFHSF